MTDDAILSLDRACATATLGDRLSLALIGLCVALVVAFPGDAPLGDDEAILIGNALDANRAGCLATMGLGGTFGYGYGPLPTQIYQAMLLVTHDLRAIVVMRGLAFYVTIAVAMWSIAAALRLPRWFIAVVLVSPWLWWHARNLWDNTFIVPLGFVALAAYVRWLAAPTRLNAAGWSAAATGAVLVHLGATPMALSLFGHALLCRFGAFRRSLGWIFLGIALASATSIPYIVVTTDQLAQSLSLRVHGYDSSPPAPTVQVHQFPRLKSTVYALLGTSLLGGPHQSFGQYEILNISRALRTFSMVSLGAYLWMIAGAGIAVLLVSRRSNDPRRSIAAVTLIAIALQACVFAAMRVQYQDHYLGGALPATVLLCWIGAEFFWRRPWMRIVVIAPSLATAACTILLAITIHRVAGGRDFIAPTLGNLIDISFALRDAHDESAWTDCEPLIVSQHRLKIVRDANGAPQGAADNMDSVPLLIRYRNAFPGDGHVIVERADPPADFVLISIKPLDSIDR